MDAAALTAAIEMALNEVEGPSVNVPFGIDSIVDAKRGELIRPVLNDQPEFDSQLPLMLNSVTNLSAFSGWFVAPMIMREARVRQSAEAAVEWLQKVLSTESAALVEVQTLYGISVEEAVDLTDGVQLLSFDSLPESAKTHLISNNSFIESLTIAGTPPTAAIVRQAETRPLLVKMANRDQIRTVRAAESIDVEELRLCIAQAGPTKVLAGPSCCQFVDADLQAAVLASVTSSFHQEVSPISILPVEVPLDDVPQFISAYMGLDASVRNRVHTALERLHQSLLRSRPGDQAIELSIALETMLLAGERGDNTHKIGLRTALLTSNDLSERLTTRSLAKAAYEIRSALMHGGGSKAKLNVAGIEGPIPAAEVTKLVGHITTEVIRRIVAQGRFPDWTLLELSQGAQLN